MPPIDDHRRAAYQGWSGPAPERPPADDIWPPRVIDPALLVGLPVPVQVMIATALLPLEVALTSVRILKNTEELLGELVFHLNALRPAVAGVSQAYANGQFDQVFRTIDQIQHGTNAFALVWAPFSAVRDRLVPGSPVPEIPAPPPPRRAPGSYAYPPPMPPPAVSAPPPPSTVEWLGRLGGQVWGHAATLPGAGLVAAPLRMVGQAFAEPGPGPDDVELRAVAPVFVERVEEPEPVVADRPGSGLPGPIRWLLGVR